MEQISWKRLFNSPILNFIIRQILLYEYVRVSS